MTLHLGILLKRNMILAILAFQEAQTLGTILPVLILGVFLV